MICKSNKNENEEENNHHYILKICNKFKQINIFVLYPTIFIKNTIYNSKEKIKQYISSRANKYATQNNIPKKSKGADKNFKNEKKLNKLEEKEEKVEKGPNKYFENTEILHVKVKISKNKYCDFKLKRYDDAFLTIQYFCEINNLDEKLIKPLIFKSLCAINTIYIIMNCDLDDENLDTLREIKNKSNKKIFNKNNK